MAQQATTERIQELVRELQKADTSSKKFELSAEIARVSEQMSDSSSQDDYSHDVPVRDDGDGGPIGAA
jgi:hypothetical protein